MMMVTCLEATDEILIAKVSKMDGLVREVVKLAKMNELAEVQVMKAVQMAKVVFLQKLLEMSMLLLKLWLEL